MCVCLTVCVCVSCRWFFGDGGYEEYEYKPPYDPSLLSLESPNQILLSNNVTYIYSQPGIRVWRIGKKIFFFFYLN